MPDEPIYHDSFEQFGCRYEVRWAGGDVEVTRHFPDERPPAVSTMTLENVLAKGYSCGHRSQDLALREAIVEGPISIALSDEASRRLSFWRAFDASAMPDMRARYTRPDSPSAEAWCEPAGFCFTMSGMREGAEPYCTRWDQIFFHGPVIGGLDLSFRKKLRDGLLDALDEDYPERGGAFPLLDYARLPYGERWSKGDRLHGSEVWFEEGWLIMTGWDNRGRPEGGRNEYAIEPVLTGSLRHVPIPREVLQSLRVDAIASEGG